MNDAYLVHRDAVLTVMERYVLFNDFLNREEMAALMGLSLPKKPTAPNPDPDLEALKRVLTPDYTPVTPPEPVKFEAPKMGTHCQCCKEDAPMCPCLTCAKDDHNGSGLLYKDNGEPPCCEKRCHKRNCKYLTTCPDYVPEAPHDPLP